MRQRAAFFYAWAECGISARIFVIIYIMVHSKRILAFCISGGIFTLIAGTLGHFVYEWSGGAVWTAWLFPVNESVWEHLKLLILPAVVFFALGAYFMRGANNYISALFFCIAVSAGFVTGAFYLYTSVIGHSVLAMDIAVFIASVALGYVTAYFLLTAERFPLLTLISLAGLIITLVCFFTFTFSPPHSFLFRAPDGTFGIACAPDGTFGIARTPDGAFGIACAPDGTFGITRAAALY